MKTLSVDFGGKEFFAAGNGHIAAVVVRMIAAIATHEHNPRLPLTIQSLKIPQKEKESRPMINRRAELRRGGRHCRNGNVSGSFTRCRMCAARELHLITATANARKT
jgi:hypothetical protein